jgi:hypothetical protein
MKNHRGRQNGMSAGKRIVMLSRKKEISIKKTFGSIFARGKEGFFVAMRWGWEGELTAI